jgi:predicted nucleic acid-binding protein
MLVVDASAVVALLLDGGPDGDFVATATLGERLAAPHLLPVEVMSVLGRAVRTGKLGTDAASLALADLHILPVALAAFGPLAARVWELREAVSPYDGWYVALAERLDVPLVTLDRKLAGASGPRCSFLTP